ncbi:MAG: hypothetical protein ABTQ34_08310 [Bdellovibrionales bacterium]
MEASKRPCLDPKQIHIPEIGAGIALAGLYNNALFCSFNLDRVLTPERADAIFGAIKDHGLKPRISCIDDRFIRSTIMGHGSGALLRSSEYSLSSGYVSVLLVVGHLLNGKHNRMTLEEIAPALETALKFRNTFPDAGSPQFPCSEGDLREGADYLRKRLNTEGSASHGERLTFNPFPHHFHVNWDNGASLFVPCDVNTGHQVTYIPVLRRGETNARPVCAATATPR